MRCATSCRRKRSCTPWWSYRAADWAAADKGRRLDHIWVTPHLAERLDSAEVIREARGWRRPSDHVPVIVRIGAGSGAAVDLGAQSVKPGLYRSVGQAGVPAARGGRGLDTGPAAAE